MTFETKKSPTSPKQAFDQLWISLFKSRIHLDSALSKLDPKVKAGIATWMPEILRRPVSLARALGFSMAKDEPWDLSGEGLARWELARGMFKRLMAAPLVESRPDTSLQDFPIWMQEQWVDQWGEEVAERLADRLALAPPQSLRVASRVSRQEVIEQLQQELEDAPEIKISEWTPFGIRIDGHAKTRNTEAFKKGLFEIQDEGSQWMSLFALWPERFSQILSSEPAPSRLDLDATPEIPKSVDSALRVVDACSGAGGKALAMADALRNRGRVFAYDTVEGKLKALKRRATHAGLNNIQALALTEDEEWKQLEAFEKSAHIVLVDAPCSGWGVLRRNPDIKWRQTSEELARMPEIQLRLLDLYGRLTRPGGRLVYGVCTFRKEETIDLVEQFLETHPDFVKKEGGFLGPWTSDGFFMQALERKKA